MRLSPTEQDLPLPRPTPSPATPPTPERDDSRPKTASFAALIAGSVAIGFAPVFVRLSEVGPSATGFWRVTLALPLLWAWSAWERSGGSQRSGRANASDRPMLLLAGAAFAGDLAVWHWSLRFTSVANATLLANLASVWVVLFGWWFLRHRVSGRFLLAMIVALAGMALLTLGKPRLGHGADSGHRALGDALGVATAVFYAAYMLAVKQVRERLPTGTVMAWSGVVTAVFLLPAMWAMHEPFWPATARGWCVVAALAGISQVLGQSAIAFALARLPAAFVSVVLLVQPVASAAAAWLVLGERLGWAQWIGGAFVLAGILGARQENR